ncbi:hypothetical protein GH714_012322 [Hevea brasiliensis]|uniref:Uncharacterized protein n=1 Tax=Hevea brasiliensis TaxID=3981 RepID=A0A6A6MML8_HEVBR|nr:hypothetical protein GH714_012322 [Hevea brasiliensis]
MGEIAASFFTPCQPQVLLGHYSSGKWKGKHKKKDWQCHALAEPFIKNQMATKPATYSSGISTDIPLYESPGVEYPFSYLPSLSLSLLPPPNYNAFNCGWILQASFDRYLEDKPRVFKAMFPDKRRSQLLNEDEWRIQMLPINFFFLAVLPTVDMRLRSKSGGRDYPPGVPKNITKVLELDITRWQLEGLDNVLEPSHFSLGVKGALYADRLGARTRLKGQLEMNITFVLPPVLALIPEDIRRNVAELVLRRLVQDMKRKVNGSLLADYSEFIRERPKN